jgi:hypothetical protein
MHCPAYKRRESPRADRALAGDRKILRENPARLAEAQASSKNVRKQSISSASRLRTSRLNLPSLRAGRNERSHHRGTHQVGATSAGGTR